MRTIDVVPYNSEWPHLFEKEAARIKKALGANCVIIHHIGSTAIPGLSAKPVIDMMPVVKDILAVDTKALEELGYIAKGEFGMPFRRYFYKGEVQRTHHLHIWEEGSSEIDKHLLFRNYLRNHSEERKRYERLKHELASRFREDSYHYTLGKEALIHEILERAGFDKCLVVQVLTPMEWEAYHRICKTQIFEPLGILYNPNHPTITAANHFHFIMSKGVKIIGVAHVEFLDDIHAVLRPFAIDAPYQRQGYGTQLLKIMERWIAHQGSTIIYLHARTKALDFYKRAGFVEMSFKDPDPEGGRSAEHVDLGKILK